MFNGRLPAETSLHQAFIKYHLCKSMKLQPSEYDKLPVDEADAYWMIDQNYIEKEKQEMEIEKSKMRSKTNG